MGNVVLKSVNKFFGKDHIIKDVSLEIQEGEFVVFVGPSGCGKSTLLRMIAGLEDVTSGDIYINHEMMNDVDSSERGVAMVFQSYALYPHMNVLENIEFSLKMQKVAKDIRRRKVEDVAKMLKLDHLLTKKPKELSGGQKQRVAIGRAIVREPVLSLFDEPLSNLDAELRAQMRVEISSLHNDLKNTSIYVTHDQVEAMTLADKIVVINKGDIEQIGTPIELYQDPDNIFVAGFIGSPKMNFINAKVVDKKQAKFFDQNISLPKELEADRVVIGIRPGEIDITNKAEIKFKANVVMSEHLGSTSNLYVKAGGQTILVDIKGLTDIKEGQEVELGVDKSSIYFFEDNIKGLRIK